MLPEFLGIKDQLHVVDDGGDVLQCGALERGKKKQKNKSITDHLTHNISLTEGSWSVSWELYAVLVSDVIGAFHYTLEVGFFKFVGEYVIRNAPWRWDFKLQSRGNLNNSLTIAATFIYNLLASWSV